MEKRKICEICNKSFSNGKALGGHVRSHYAKHPLPPPKKPLIVSNSTTSSQSQSQSSSTTVDPMEQCNYVDDETEYRNAPAPTRRRSERHCRRTVTPPPLVSDEEAAWFLIQLSRDTWYGKPREEEHVEVTPRKSFRCEACDKVFGSYQALGGHKANHKRMLKRISAREVEAEAEADDRGFIEEEVERGDYDDDDDDDGDYGATNGVEVKKRGFECEYCFKVFGSGQALGGHKKAHFSTPLANKNISSGTLVIDLNLPPLADHQHHEEMLEVEGF